MMNDFFDCSKVRSLTEHTRKRNHLIKPYESPNEERFTWMRDVFFKFLEDWKESAMTREGNSLQMIEERCFCLFKPIMV